MVRRSFWVGEIARSTRANPIITNLVKAQPYQDNTKALVQKHWYKALGPWSTNTKAFVSIGSLEYQSIGRGGH